MILIDNQENSFFPFMFLSFPKIEYSSNTINKLNIINSKMDMQFQIMIYNYVSSVWEPLVEGANCILINLYNPSNKDHIMNRYKLLLNNNNESQDNNKYIKNNENEKSKQKIKEDKTILNLSISNLTVYI